MRSICVWLTWFQSTKTDTSIKMKSGRWQGRRNRRILAKRFIKIVRLPVDSWWNKEYPSISWNWPITPWILRATWVEFWTSIIQSIYWIEMPQFCQSLVVSGTISLEMSRCSTPYMPYASIYCLTNYNFQWVAKIGILPCKNQWGLAKTTFPIYINSWISNRPLRGI